MQKSGCSPFSIIVLAIAAGMVLVFLIYPDSQFNPFHSSKSPQGHSNPKALTFSQESPMQQQNTVDIPQASSPRDDCAWCWKSSFPERDFPVGVSSNICPEHAAWMIAQARTYRTRRADPSGGDSFYCGICGWVPITCFPHHH